EDLFHFCVDIAQIIPVKVTEAPHYRRVLAMRAALSESGEDWIKRLNPGLLYYELRNQFDNLGIGPKINQATDRATTKRPPLAINAGNGFAFVSHRGDVCPSGFLPISAGNVRLEPLSVIYKTSELFKSLRDMTTLSGKCGRCEFNGVCGGSRSRAFGANNDTNSDDPSCNYVPGTFQI
ncbi:MAG: radical SAM/SPASM domain-containing protein, partial [Acidimicrobiales bacterium]|nr:radical SAM/SPASM domain-containing protein [Acidimicrobiales bacterium]